MAAEPKSGHPVPVGTAARTAELLGRDDVASMINPEFLREGSAVHDFLNPARIVVGASSQDAAERVAALYARLGGPDRPHRRRERRDDQVRGELLSRDEAVLRQRARRDM